MEPECTYVLIQATRDRTTLRARRGCCDEAWHWRPGDTRAQAAAVRKLLTMAKGSYLVTYRAGNLTTILSHPETLDVSRVFLGNLRDLFEAAVLVAGDAESFDLADLAGHLSLQAGSEPMDQLVALTDGLAARFAELPRDYHVLLSYIVGDESRLGYLPWPRLQAEDRRAPLAGLGRLTPRLPTGKRLEAEPTGLPLSEVAREFLSPGGAVEALHPQYEERPAQVAMASAVADTFHDGGMLLVEAGTGVGKSLAYLIPAVLWARENGQPVLVSTNTRNLQDQLIAQELPLLADALPMPFQAALLKGRRNYPCLRSITWLIADAADSLFWSERLAVGALVAWVTQCAEGDLEGLAPELTEELDAFAAVVQRARSQADGCSGPACPMRQVCRVDQARAQARSADIIVVNHALALEEARYPFLPQISHVVFDEAHNLEAAATENLAYELSSPLLAGFVAALGGEGRSTGLVETLQRRLAGNDDLAGVRTTSERLTTVPDYGAAVREAGEALGEALAHWCLSSARPAQRRDRERSAIRLTREAREGQAFFPVADALQGLLDAAESCQSELEVVGGALEEIPENSRPELQGLAAEVAAVAGRLRDLIEAGKVVLQSAGDEEEYVTWTEAWERQGRVGWSMRAAPVDVGPLLRELFYDRKTAVVFTSATLSVEGDFAHFRRRLGLDRSQHGLRAESYPSPFQLTEQLLLCVARDMPDPRQPDFDERVTEALGAICRLAQGGTLALFTSRARMEAAFAELEDELADQGLRPLCQELSGPRWWLLDQLRQHPRTVLFGLKSFWEGVDVPGSALRCVVLCKLPFAVPDDPIVAARMEAIERRGGNPMGQYYFPEAILGFKQGIGRLIRRKTDRGIVVVLDPRLVTRSYGGRFFRSIQRCALVREPLEVCLDRAREWLRDDGMGGRA